MDKAVFMENVSLRCGERQCLSDISMTVARGEIVAVCGTESSQKQYFTNLFLRLYDAKYTLTGTLCLNGVEIERLSEEDMRYVRMVDVAVLPHVMPRVAENMTVLSYITKPFNESIKKSKREIILDAKRVMELLGIANAERVFKKRMSALHVKDLRAVLYAAALATDPAVAIAYGAEPDMSPDETDELYTLLIKVCKIKNIALILLTADIAFAKRHGEHVYCMKGTHLVDTEDGTYPYEKYLQSAAVLSPIIQQSHGNEALLQADNLVLRRGSRSLSFSLYDGQMAGVLADSRHALRVFTGFKRPLSGSVLSGGKSIMQIKPATRGVFPITLGQPMLSKKTVESLVAEYAAAGGAPMRTRCGMETAHAIAAAGCAADFAKATLEKLTDFEKLQCGIACAIAAKARVLLLCDIERLPQQADRYELLSVTASVCQNEHVGALILTDNAQIATAAGVLGV